MTLMIPEGELMINLEWVLSEYREGQGSLVQSGGAHGTPQDEQEICEDVVSRKVQH